MLTSIDWHKAFVTTARTLIFTAMLLPGHVLAQNAWLKVYESTFNAFGEAIEPVVVTGRYRLKVGLITLCNARYRVEVSDLRFQISPEQVDVTGQASATWCGFSFGGSGPELNADGNIIYDSSSEAVCFHFESATVQPSIQVSFIAWSGTIRLPVHIQIADSLNIPCLPVRYARLRFNTAAGSRSLLMEADNVTLVKRQDYVELTSQVAIR